MGIAPNKKKIQNLVPSCIDALLMKRLKKGKPSDGGEYVDRKRKKAEEVVHQCDACGEMPRVWSSERDTIIAKDEIKHGPTFTVMNSTRCKIA